MFAILCTVVSFGIAVYATNANIVEREVPNHFSESNRTGDFPTWFQTVSGMRPSGPKKTATPVEVPKDVEETFEMTYESSDEFGRTLHSGSDSDDEVSGNAKTSGKSIARHIWEFKHCIMGFSLLGLSWYNCDAGFELFAERYR
jgi:hypothetical protein